MKIIKGTEPIPVDTPIFLIVGQPGICKTSLGYSMDEPLLLDFDEGSHRAVNRRDTGVVKTWADVESIEQNPSIIAPYNSLVVDTVGRCLDKMALDIIAKDPKMGRGGGELSIQGFGRLKARFRAWITQTRALGKNILLLAHAVEEKDGDEKTIRADIMGGSYAEVMKIADFVGYLYMLGNKRIVDFNPTSKWVGKNPAQWRPLEVPPPDRATEFMAELYAKGREALGQISAKSAEFTKKVDEWRAQIAQFERAHEFTAAIPHVQQIKPKAVQEQVKRILMDAAKARNIEFDRAKRHFVDPAPPLEPEPTPEEIASQDLGW